jgi:signal transduction histidine kinase/DNA-binding NarL/FixJ family response regulator
MLLVAVSASAAYWSAQPHLADEAQHTRAQSSIEIASRTPPPISRNLLGWSAAALSLAACAALLFAHRFLAPLREISGATRALSRGELSRRLNIERTDEIGELATGFNQMAANFEFQTEKLTEALENAHVASRSKSEFLSNMSHEIRTPLSAVVGYADLLAGAGQSHADRAAWTRDLRRNSNHLLSLVNDILDLSKIEAGKMEIRRESTSPFDILMHVLSMMEAVAAEKLLDLSVRFDGLIPREIQSDPIRIRQILINLVGNALKFTDRGEIVVSVSCKIDDLLDTTQLRIVVEDTGIGITPEQIENIFSPFTQVATSEDRRAGGSGLGLDISSRMARMLNGDLSVESNLGRGSQFTLTLDVGRSSDIDWVDAAELEDLEATPLEETGETDSLLKGASLLIVEDGEHNRRILEYLLEEAGATVYSATDGLGGVAAVQAAREQNNDFDVILMDIQMPRMNGIEATEQLRSMGVETPIIALTAYALARDQENCLAAGCTDYVAKPFVASDLKRIIAKHLPTRLSKAPTQEPIDPVLVSNLTDNEKFLPLLKIYLDGVPVMIDDIEQSVEAADREQVGRLIHQLKGSAGRYGFPSVSIAANEVMTKLRDDVSLEELDAMIKDVLALLRSMTVT